MEIRKSHDFIVTLYPIVRTCKKRQSSSFPFLFIVCVWGWGRGRRGQGMGGGSYKVCHTWVKIKIYYPHLSFLMVLRQPFSVRSFVRWL